MILYPILTLWKLYFRHSHVDEYPWNHQCTNTRTQTAANGRHAGTCSYDHGRLLTSTWYKVKWRVIDLTQVTLWLEIDNWNLSSNHWRFINKIRHHLGFYRLFDTINAFLSTVWRVSVIMILIRSKSLYKILICLNANVDLFVVCFNISLNSCLPWLKYVLFKIFRFWKYWIFSINCWTYFLEIRSYLFHW